MAKPKKPGGPKQKLSPAAAAAKKKRDERIAMTPKRRKRKAETQKFRRHAEARGESVKGKDVHHTSSGKLELISTHKNRGNYGKGTKREGNELSHRKHHID